MRFYKTKKDSAMRIASLYTFLTFILILFLTAGCVRKDVHPVDPITNIECDAGKPCDEQYECIKLPNKEKPVCVAPGILRRPEYEGCELLESYPARLKCPEAKIPVTKECSQDSDCKVSGCNGEICAKEELYSICLAKPEFACFKLIDCKCINGKCGWDKTEEFMECFEEKTFTK